MITEAKKENTVAIEVELNEGIDEGLFKTLCRSMGRFNPECFNVFATELEGRKGELIDEEPMANIEKLRSAMEKASISEVVIALLLQELLVGQDGEFGNEILDAYKDRLRQITRVEYDDVMENPNEAFMYSTLCGILITDELTGYRQSKAG